MKWPNGNKCWADGYCNNVGGGSVSSKKQANKFIGKGNNNRSSGASGARKEGTRMEQREEVIESFRWGDQF